MERLKRKLRSRVDERLKEYVLDDSLGVLENVNVVEVFGSKERRLSQALEAIGKRMKMGEGDFWNANCAFLLLH